MKVIVHDRGLWDEYRGLAEDAYRQERAGPYPQMGRNLLEPVDGFGRVYGESRSNTRPFEDGKIIRNDLFLVKGDTIVVQVVDYIAEFRSLGTPTGLSCLDRYGPIYNRKRDGLDALVRDLTVVRIADAGHFVPWQRPEPVTEAMQAWLGGARG